MGLREVLRYLVTLQLSGRGNVVRAIYDYFVLSGSVGNVKELAERHGLSRDKLRGYVQRFVERCGYGDRIRRAKIFARYLAPLVLAVVEPAVEHVNGGIRCRICGATLLGVDTVLASHFQLHRDLVEQYVEQILSILRECCRKGICTASSRR